MTKFVLFSTLTLFSNAILRADQGLNFEVSLGHSKLCKDLAAELNDNFTLASFTASKRHTSGKPFLMTFSIRKKRKIDSSVWNEKWQFFNISSVIAVPYQKILTHKTDPSLIQFLFSDTPSQEFKVMTEVAENIGGNAIHQLSITLLDHTYQPCMLEAVVGDGSFFESRNPDITPPLVKKIKYDREAYAPGGTAVVTIQFTEPLKYSTTDHLQFTNQNLPISDVNRSFPEYSADGRFKLKNIAPDTYQISVKIPESTPQGSFTLDFLNRYDRLDNFEDTVGVESLDEKKVAETSPLVVN